MVSTTVLENGDVPAAIKVSPNVGVPPGNYRLVGWDMDATGKRFIDGICQIAIYTPGSEYSQYVMPFKDLTPPARKRHHLKVVTVGCYRVLKNSFTNKVLKTKSEVSALMDFLGWLEAVKGDATDGVILVHHEPRRVNPSMLIEALTKYNLLDKFKEIVKGFANGFDIAKAKCASTLKVFSLRTLSRVFLDKEQRFLHWVDLTRWETNNNPYYLLMSNGDFAHYIAFLHWVDLTRWVTNNNPYYLPMSNGDFLHYISNEEELSSAAHRARLALQIVQHLSVGEENGKVDEEIGSGDREGKATEATVEFIREFVQSVEAEEKECAELKLVLVRQNSLKPIFGPLLNNTARRERQHASPLRRLLAESAIDYVQLQEAWADGKKDGVEKLLNEKVTAERKEIEDLTEIIECHFDPDKKPAQTSDEDKKNLKKIKPEKKKATNNNNNNNISGTESPDTTSCSPVKPKVEAGEELVETVVEVPSVAE